MLICHFSAGILAADNIRVKKIALRSSSLFPRLSIKNADPRATQPAATCSRN